MLRIASHCATNKMRVHGIKEWQTIEAKDSTLQSGKDSQRALIPCLNVPMQLLKKMLTKLKKL